MKRLITCSDGTWDRPGLLDRGKKVKSNVEIIFNRIPEISHDGVVQLKVYDTGIGADAYTKDMQISEGMTGQGIDKKIKDIYTFLILNYEKGDEIYLFGFSRGAYTARSLVGFIRNCGILKPENLHLIDTAYELYRNRNSYTSPDSDLMVGFKRNYCFEDVTPIKFIGVWDTVGSLGTPIPYCWYLLLSVFKGIIAKRIGIPLPDFKYFNSNRYKFHDVTLSSTVQNAYHALAVDERRKLFKPTLWELSNSVKNEGAEQKMEQRWFPGVHCNVGGGYENCGLSDLPLKWLIDNAEVAGLNFGGPIGKGSSGLKPDCDAEMRNSRTLIYWFWRPIWRDVLKGENTNETIDPSVFARRSNIKNNYNPENIQ